MSYSLCLNNCTAGTCIPSGYKTFKPDTKNNGYTSYDNKQSLEINVDSMNITVIIPVTTKQ